MSILILFFFTQYKGFCFTILEVNQFKFLEIDLEPDFYVGTGKNKPFTFYKIDLILFERIFRLKLFKDYGSV